jgi:hypothetical protein
MADRPLSAKALSRSEQGAVTPRSLISSAGHSYNDSASYRVKICVRGVENLPLVTNPANSRKEPCDACARLIVGNQVIKTAVINGALSARWEHECEVNVGGEESDDLEVELLHCDRVGADRHLGSAIIRFSDIIKLNTAKSLPFNRAIEKTFPLLTLDRDALCGQDSKNTIITLSFTLLDNASPVPSDSDEEDSLPQSNTKSAQYKLLAESREGSLRSLFSVEASPAQEVKSVASHARGGVGLKFKVPLPIRSFVQGKRSSVFICWVTNSQAFICSWSMSSVMCL